MFTENNHVLLIEADEAQRALRVHLLERAGYGVTTLPDWAAAESAGSEEEFDLVIVTVEDDPAATFGYSDRLIERLPNLPIVWLTGQGQWVPLNEAIQASEGRNPQLLMQQVATALNSNI